MGFALGLWQGGEWINLSLHAALLMKMVLLNLFVAGEKLLFTPKYVVLLELLLIHHQKWIHNSVELHVVFGLECKRI